MNILNKIADYKCQQDKAGVVNQVYRMTDEEVVELITELNGDSFVHSTKEVFFAKGLIDMYTRRKERLLLEDALRQVKTIYGVKLRLEDPVYTSKNTYRYC